MTYDPNNIFAKILRGEIPCQKIYEDDHVLAFHDIQPQAPIHALVIPKGNYLSFDDFARNADPLVVAYFLAKTTEIARSLGIYDDGYRVVTNCGKNGGQEVPHFHIHLLGGAPIGPLVAR